MSSRLTAAPTLVGSLEDLQSFKESLEKAVRMARQFSKPLEQAAHISQQAARVSRQVCNEDTREKWDVVKPIFESAPPHEKRRLGNMTIGEAFAFYSRRASTSARAKLHHAVMQFIGDRVRGAARAPRRSIRSSSAKARAPGSRSGSDDPHPLEALHSSLASAGLFCVPAHACGVSPPARLSLRREGSLR
jgi:hypothetical protein